MATKTVAVVATVDPLHGIPSNIKVLCENIVKARGTERNNWADFAHYVGITQDVPVSVEFPTGKKPVGVNDARKKQCSAWFTAITMQSDVIFVHVEPKTGKVLGSAAHNTLKAGTDIFKSAVKEAQTHYSSCIQRALRTLGYMAPKTPSTPPAESDGKGSTVTTVSPASPLDGRMISIAALLEQLTVRATEIDVAMVAFQTSNKLTSKARNEHGDITASFGKLRGLIGELAQLIVPEPVKGTLAGIAANLPPPVPGAVPTTPATH